MKKKLDQNKIREFESYVTGTDLPEHQKQIFIRALEEQGVTDEFRYQLHYALVAAGHQDGLIPGLRDKVFEHFLLQEKVDAEIEELLQKYQVAVEANQEEMDRLYKEKMIAERTIRDDYETSDRGTEASKVHDQAVAKHLDFYESQIAKVRDERIVLEENIIQDSNKVAQKYQQDFKETEGWEEESVLGA